MNYIINVGIFIFNLIYAIFKLLPQNKKVSIISRQSNIPSTDIKLLQAKISKMYDEYKIVILCKKLDSGLKSKFSYFFHIFRQMYHMATSEIVILDSYCIAASILRHKKSLLIIQMWHSIGTMKKFGYSILDKPEGSSSKIAGIMKMHANYDYIFAAGDGYRRHLAEGFNYPHAKIITMPLPRVELLKDANYSKDVKKRVFITYPQLQEKKNIVYVPTFRKDNANDFLNALLELCSSIDYTKYNLIVKVHPLTDLKDFNGGKAIIDNSFSSFEMLFVSDIVISDYSCIMYEAAVLKKPIYLYTYDYDEYMSGRDIYMNYKSEVPGPVCNTAADLANSIDKNNYDYLKLDYFLNKYVYMGSEHETEDMVQFIFGHRKAR